MRTLLGGAAATAGENPSIAAKTAARTSNMTRRDAFTYIPPSHDHQRTNGDTQLLLGLDSAIQDERCVARAAASLSMPYSFARIPSNSRFFWFAARASGNWPRQGQLPPHIRVSSALRPLPVAP